MSMKQTMTKMLIIMFGKESVPKKRQFQSGVGASEAGGL
jgi:hypothetical protein